MTPADRATRCVTPVVIVLRTKLDAECNRQATVVGRLLTTLGDDRRAVTAVAKLFLVQRLGKAPKGITLIFGDIRISEDNPRLYALARSPAYAVTVYRPTALK